MILYIKRWPVVPVKMADGKIIGRSLSTPQGGVISPALANLFLHYVLDKVDAKNIYPQLK